MFFLEDCQLHQIKNSYLLAEIVFITAMSTSATSSLNSTESNNTQTRLHCTGKMGQRMQSSH